MIEIRHVPIERLKPAPYNPRRPLAPGMPGWRRLARSLREFDLVVPIVWNEATGHVVGGHQRLEVLKHDGVKEVAVSVVSLSLEREKALNVTLNNAQVGSDWDHERLVDLVAELTDLPDFDASLTGFDESDIRDLLFVPEPELPPESDRDDDDASIVRCVLELEPSAWEAFRIELDELLSRHPVRIHVRMPESSRSR